MCSYEGTDLREGMIVTIDYPWLRKEPRGDRARACILSLGIDSGEQGLATLNFTPCYITPTSG